MLEVMLRHTKTSVFLICMMLAAFVQGQSWQGFYKLNVKLDGMPVRYSEVNSHIIISDDEVTAVLDFKMVKPSTAATNYAVCQGRGTGSLDFEKLTINGTGNILTFERGRQDDALPFNFTINGSFVASDTVNHLTGNITLEQDGSKLMGSINAKGGYFVKLKVVRGSYSIMRANASHSWIDGKANDHLGIGDKVKADANSLIEMIFDDGSIFRIKSNTLLVYTRGGVDIKGEGEVWFSLVKSGNQFYVKTPSSVVGVLGTEFIVSVDKEGNSMVNLLRGRVNVTNNSGTQIVLEQGNSVSATASGFGSTRSIDVDKVKAQFDSSDNPSVGGEAFLFSTLFWIIAGSAGLLLLMILLLIIIVVARKRKRRKKAAKKIVPPAVAEPVMVKPSPVVPAAPFVPPTEHKHRFCTSCGKPLRDGARFCFSCGKEAKL